MKNDIKQYGVLLVGLLIGGGFAFGGTSYAGLVSGGQGNSQGGGQQDFNASLPTNNYQESAYDLTQRQQQVLALRNDVVFVNGFYSNSSQKEKMENLSSLPSKFDNRVYVSVANSSSDSDLIYSYGLTEFPRIVVIGGNTNFNGRPLKAISNEKVQKQICNAFRNIEPFAGKCLYG